MEKLTDELAANDGVETVSSYLDGRGNLLISQDGHATILPVVLAEDEEVNSIEAVVESVQAADGKDGFAVDIAGESPSASTSKRSPRTTFSKASSSSAFPPR